MIVTFSIFLAQADTASKSDDGFTDIIIIWTFAIIILAWFMVRSTLKRVKMSQIKDQASVNERVARQMPKGESNIIQSQISELMAELANLSRQINGQIDTRVAKLEILLKDAEKTIDRLENQLNNTSSNSRGSDKFRRKSNSENVNNSQAKPWDLQQNNLPQMQPANHISNDKQTQEILNLANQGKSAVHIAQKLDRPIGEIELILSLNKK